METICLWPDGEWCYLENYENGEMNWKSDDFKVIEVPYYVEDIESWLEGEECEDEE